MPTVVACGSQGTTASGNGATSPHRTDQDGTPTSPATKKPKQRSAEPKPPAQKPAAKKPAAAAKIVFVNVGQGDAEIVKSGSWCGLIDGGPSGSEAAIESELRRLGVSRLDAVVVSHPHADHTGGLSGVVYDYRPKAAYVGEGAGSATASLRAVGARITKVRRGTTLRFGSLRAKVLSPGSLTGDANEDSVVLLLEAGGKRFLFTGDCTGANETVVGSICARGPPVYLLKVAHHGSRHSTSSGFLAETDPTFAVIGVGPNSYGHPTPETVSALRSSGARIYSTQNNGSITVTVSSSGRVTWVFGATSRPVTKVRTSGGGTSSGGTQGGGTSSGSNGATVYITDTGECYHLGSCRYLRRSKIPISLKDARSRGYRPCSVCGPPQ